MGEHTEIAWTDHSFNTHWGCQRISPACEHCYAQTFSRRIGGSPWGKGEHWGPGSLRTLAPDGAWQKLAHWNDKAAKDGVRRNVFVGSMMDVFEDRRDLDAPRERLFAAIERFTALDFLLLTKRADKIVPLTPERWRDKWPRNAWAGTTVEDQRRADERIPHLLRCPAPVRFVSAEPLLEAVDLEAAFAVYDSNGEPSGPRCNPDGSLAIGWVIVGGESGPSARPFDIAWARSLRDQCRKVKVPFFFKQGGSANACQHNAKGGCLDCIPADLRVRELPEVRDED